MIFFSIVLLVILSLFSYFGGTLFPIGLVFIFISLICSIGISVIYIINYIKSKKMNLFMFSFILIIFASTIGYFVGTARTKKIEQELLTIRQFVNSYYTENNDLPNEQDDFFNKYKYKVKILDEGNGSYTIYYYDAIAFSEDENIHYRPRP